jgi:hypothetical protein
MPRAIWKGPVRLGLRRKAIVAGGGAVAMIVTLHGCAALPVAVVGTAVLGSGAGAIVKTGTEYTFTGAARRTFTVPINAVRAAVLAAFDMAGVQIRETEAGDGDYIAGDLHQRTVRVRLTPLSHSLTGMTLIVKRNPLVNDRATSSELLEQIEQVLAENPSFAKRLHRVRHGDEAASP